MLSKIEQSALRSLLDRIARTPIDGFDIEAATIYWHDVPDDFETFALAIQGLHAMEELPLPEMPCLVIHPSFHFEQWDHDRINAKCATFTADVFLPSDPRSGQPAVSGVRWSVERYGDGSQHIDPPEPFSLVRVDFADSHALAEYVAKRCPGGPVMPAADYARYGMNPAAFPEVERQWLLDQQCQLAQMPNDGSCLWETAFYIASHRDDLPASAYLEGLTPCACPCFYKVASGLKQGVGSKGQKRRTQGKPIFMRCNYQRVYRTLKLLAGDRRIIGPHFTKGHAKYQWKAAGINRKTLPERAVDRVALAKRHKVQARYCPAYWTGLPDELQHGTYEGMDWRLE